MRRFRELKRNYHQKLISLLSVLSDIDRNEKTDELARTGSYRILETEKEIFYHKCVASRNSFVSYRKTQTCIQMNLKDQH